MTPHNEAKKGDIAKVVLMPGDPLRAKFIAETFLEDAVCFNTVRGMLGYTGLYNGKCVSVMGSGWVLPSMGIYATSCIIATMRKRSFVSVRRAACGRRGAARFSIGDGRVHGLELCAPVPFAGHICADGEL